jgi:hypothetical protein
MAKKKQPKRTTRSTSTRKPVANSFGWVEQPPPPTIDELVSKGTYARAGVTRELLEAQQRLREHLTSPETLERAHFEREPGMIGPEGFAGTFIGSRWKKGKRTKHLCLVAMVQKKVKDPARVCESVHLHNLKDRVGADIDVIGIGQPRATSWNDLVIPDGITFQEEKPIRCGASIGPRAGTRPTGTYGALVLGKDGKVYLLSNNHVLAGVSGIVNGQVSVGLPQTTSCFHRGPVDDPDLEGFDIGDLTLASRLLLSTSPPSPLSREGQNTVDAAIAHTDIDTCQYQWSFLDTDIQQKPMQSADLERGMKVQKVGRTTGWTHGTLDGFAGYSGAIQYGIPGGGLQPTPVFAGFLDVLVVVSNDRFSDRGDSGSAMLTDTGGKPQCFGLLFGGGGPDASGLFTTFIIPIQKVFDTLKLERFINSD